ncbi:ECA polysaccharide chain length modulation protein [Serratia microhaemolytica]|uniref:ECA polysaccharide chain length modulation protein n=1 Tax=Serratia microhaemolytica TaxID=2675110 RepID=UPI000FDCF9FF|nr:ECA polysaccharide chain length modulation protein [Serratia microhaemolytica]
MKSEKTSENNQLPIENVLDIAALCHTLWRGKVVIVGFALLFAATALLLSYLVKQQWSAQAVTQKPTVIELTHYYAQQQFLNQLLSPSTQNSAAEQPEIADNSYQEFVIQLAAYDTRRDFWLQSDYYRQRRQGDSRADAALLDELINNIRFTARDDKKVLNDTVKLTAESAGEAAQLLVEYINFANARAVQQLNQQLQGIWRARAEWVATELTHQQAVASAAFQRELNTLTEALKLAEQQGISIQPSRASRESLTDSELFLLGKPLLQTRLNALQAIGPHYDAAYDRNQALLSTLQKNPPSDVQFKTYRYLHTPEEPVRRDSPRRSFWLLLWGGIGVMVGVGVVLLRRPQRHQ